MSYLIRDPELSFEILRLRFWEVSGSQSDNGRDPPFYDARVDAQITDYDMAVKMDMSLSDYQKFENGDVRALPRDILRFCEAVEYHPLDLYIEPQRQTFLTQDMFGTLLLVLENDDRFSVSFVERAWDRLHNEFQRLDARLRTSIDGLSPVLKALGYAPDLSGFDLSRCHLADVRRAPFTEEPAKRPGKISLKMPPKTTPVSVRAQLHRHIDAHLREIGRDVAMHAQLAKTTTGKIERNVNIMYKFIVQLYDKNYIDQAYNRVLSLVQTTAPDDITRLRDDLVKDPEILAPLLPEHLSAFKVGNEGAIGQIEVKVRFLFVGARILASYNKAFPQNDVDRYAKAAQKRLDDMMTWRQQSATLDLLGCFENWLVLKEKLAEKAPPNLAITYTPRPA